MTKSRNERGMGRGPDVCLVACPLDEVERDFADHLKAAAGLTSDANLVRSALYHFAVQLGVPVHPSTFRLRGTRTYTGRRRNLRTHPPRSYLEDAQ